MADSRDADKQVITRLIERVWVGGDLDALPSFWTEDCVNHAALGDPVGLALLRDYHAGFASQLDGVTDVEIAVLRQVAEADVVVTHLVTSGRHTGEVAGRPPTGRRVDLVTIRIDRFRDGKIAEHWSVADITGLMAQLGSA